MPAMCCVDNYIFATSVWGFDDTHHLSSGALLCLGLFFALCFFVTRSLHLLLKLSLRSWELARILTSVILSFTLIGSDHSRCKVAILGFVVWW